MRTHSPLRFFILVFAGFVAALSASAQQNWRWANMLPASIRWKDVAYGNGVYVLIGEDATIASSTDAINWTIRRMSTVNISLNGIAFADGKFVAVGSGTPTNINAGLILTSTDGITWTTNETVASSLTAVFTDVIYGNGMWLIPASASRALTSTDGSNWTIRDAGTVPLQGTFGGGKFVFTNGNNSVVVTTDGVNWTRVAVAGAVGGNTPFVNSVTYANGKFVAMVRDSNFNALSYTSTDGVSWTAGSTIAASSSGIPYITTNGTLLVAAGGAGVFSSTDGLTWTARTSVMPPTRASAPGSLSTEAFGAAGCANGIFFGTGIYGTITTSPDGVTWTKRSSGTAHDINGLIYDGTRFVGTGTGGTVVTSPDGIAWTAASTNQTGWFGRLAYANGRYVSAGISGLFQSTNLATWTAVTSNQMYGVIYANNLFVAAPNGGLALGIRTSTDGVTWNTVTVSGNPVGSIYGLAGGGGSFVVTTGGGGGTTKIYSSTTGSTWTDSTPTGLTAVPESLAYGNSRYVLLTTGQSWTSTNGGTSWTLTPLSPQVSNVLFVGSNFVARANDGSFMQSTDGVTWTAIPNSRGPNQQLTAMVAKDNQVIGVGGGGTILIGDIGTGTTSGGSNIGRLINMSIRTNAGTGDDTLIVGVTLGGTGTNGTKPILVRGVGPTLRAFDVTNALADPIMTAFQNNTPVAQNDDWAGGFDFTSLGAFGFTGTPVKDAAIYQAAAPIGGYSVQIIGKNGATGVALAEIYDATPSGTFTVTTPRLVNVSARAQVGTGDNVLIAGFVVGGSASVRVLVRAAGPSLTAFGVSGALVNPKLELYGAGTAKIGENDDWAGTAELKAAATSVGAFGFASDTSKDAALIATLAPGSYSAIITGVGNTTGVGLVEVYELP